MKRILSFLLLVAVLVIAASYTAPRSSVESIDLPPGPPTDAEISEMLTAAATVWPAATEVHTATIWPGQELWPLEVTDERGVAAWAAPEPVYLYALTTCPTMEPVTLDLYPGWNLFINPYIYVGSLQSLFWNLQIWWDLERMLP